MNSNVHSRILDKAIIHARLEKQHKMLRALGTTQIETSGLRPYRNSLKSLEKAQTPQNSYKNRPDIFDTVDLYTAETTCAQVLIVYGLKSAIQDNHLSSCLSAQLCASMTCCCLGIPIVMCLHSETGKGACPPLRLS